MDQKCKKHIKDDHLIREWLQLMKKVNKASNSTKSDDVSIFQSEYDSRSRRFGICEMLYIPNWVLFAKDLTK